VEVAEVPAGRTTDDKVADGAEGLAGCPGEARIAPTGTSAVDASIITATATANHAALRRGIGPVDSSPRKLCAVPLLIFMPTPLPRVRVV